MTLRAAITSVLVSLVLGLFAAGALFSGFYFLLLPCYRLCRTGAADEACHLFNRASYYPLSMLLVTILSWAT